MMRNMGKVFITIAFALLLLSPLNTYATDIEQHGLSVTSNADGTYTYELAGAGSFETNVSENATVESAFFRFSEDLAFDLMRDDNIVSYTSGDEIINSGEYTLYVFPSDDNMLEYSELHFTVANNQVIDDNDLEQLAPKISTEQAELQISYDAKSGQLVYLNKGEVVLYSTVPDGGIAVGGAAVLFAENASAYITLNGESVNIQENGMYLEPGSYSVEGQILTSAQDSIQIRSFVFRFTVIAKQTNAISVINPPPGFETKAVRLNGVVCKAETGSQFMDADGEYEFVFTSLADANISYTMRFIKDTKEPTITFDKELSHKGVKGPVSYHANEPDVKIFVYRKGEQYVFEENVIYQPGKYTLEAKDLAGNKVSYDIYVKNAYDFAGYGIWIAVGVIVMAIIVWIIYTRKNYRVS